MVAVCERSSNTDFSTPSLSSRLTPPMRSEAFSFSASQRAASLLAPLPDRTYTAEPRAMRSLTASAWIDARMSAVRARAAAYGRERRASVIDPFQRGRKARIDEVDHHAVGLVQGE